MYTKLVSPIHHTSYHCLFHGFLSCSFAWKMLAASEFLVHPDHLSLHSFVPAAPPYWDFTHKFCIASSVVCCLNCLLKCDFITGYFQRSVFTIIYFFLPFHKMNFVRRERWPCKQLRVWLDHEESIMMATPHISGNTMGMGGRTL